MKYFFYNLIWKLEGFFAPSEHQNINEVYKVNYLLVLLIDVFLFNDWWVDMLKEERPLEKVGAFVMALIAQFFLFLLVHFLGAIGYIVFSLYFNVLLLNKEQEHDRFKDWFTWQHSLLGTLLSSLGICAIFNDFGYHLAFSFVGVLIISSTYKYVKKRCDW
jgi:hypothetical protein